MRYPIETKAHFHKDNPMDATTRRLRSETDNDSETEEVTIIVREVLQHVAWLEVPKGASEDQIREMFFEDSFEDTTECQVYEIESVIRVDTK